MNFERIRHSLEATNEQKKNQTNKTSRGPSCHRPRLRGPGVSGSLFVRIDRNLQSTDTWLRPGHCRSSGLTMLQSDSLLTADRSAELPSAHGCIVTLLLLPGGGASKCLDIARLLRVAAITDCPAHFPLDANISFLFCAKEGQSPMVSRRIAVFGYPSLWRDKIQQN